MRKRQRPQRLLKRGLVATEALPPANSAAPQVQHDRVFTTCPECGADLQAAVKIYLYGVEVNNAGLVIKYDGGPQPENEDDILELCHLQDTTVYCANDHVFSSDAAVRIKDAQPPDAVEVLRIAAWPTNSNSEPDVMGDALDEIQELASHTVDLLAPPKDRRPLMTVATDLTDRVKTEKPIPASRLDAARALNSLRAFIGKSQLHAIGQGCWGKERQYFYDKLVEMAGIVRAMPKTYEQDGLGDNAIAHLHYFKGSCDWYITEKDCEPDGQHQAFGLANFGYGGELGYISIVELIELDVELDLHFTPCTLAEIKAWETH